MERRNRRGMLSGGDDFGRIGEMNQLQECVDNLEKVLYGKPRYKEKKFSQNQLKLISQIREKITVLRQNGIHVEARQWKLNFYNEDNFKQAADLDDNQHTDILVPYESIEIDDSGADDQYYYKNKIIGGLK